MSFIEQSNEVVMDHFEAKGSPSYKNYVYCHPRDSALSSLSTDKHHGIFWCRDWPYLVPEGDGHAVFGQGLDLVPPTVRDVDKVTGPDQGFEAMEISQPRKPFVVGIFELHLKWKKSFHL